MAPWGGVRNVMLAIVLASGFSTVAFFQQASFQRLDSFTASDAAAVSKRTLSNSPRARQQRHLIAASDKSEAWVAVDDIRTDLDTEGSMFSVEAEMRRKVFASNPLAPSFENALIAPFVNHPDVPGGARRGVPNGLECDPVQLRTDGLEHREQLRKSWVTYRTKQKAAECT